MTDNELAYRKALKMERDRSRSRRRYRKGMFQENRVRSEECVDIRQGRRRGENPFLRRTPRRLALHAGGGQGEKTP